MFCKNCGKRITKESLFCPFCGDLIKCPSCGNLVDKNDKCCTKCGNELSPIRKSINEMTSTKNIVGNDKLESNNLQVGSKSEKSIVKRKIPYIIVIIILLVALSITATMLINQKKLKQVSQDTVIESSENVETPVKEENKTNTNSNTEEVIEKDTNNGTITEENIETDASTDSLSEEPIEESIVTDYFVITPGHTLKYQYNSSNKTLESGIKTFVFDEPFDNAYSYGFEYGEDKYGGVINGRGLNFAGNGGSCGNELNFIVQTLYIPYKLEDRKEYTGLRETDKFLLETNQTYKEYENCIKITFDLTNNDCFDIGKGKGYYYLAKDIGIVYFYLEHTVDEYDFIKGDWHEFKLIEE